MKILIVGSDKVYAIENFYKKYLEERGEKVYLFTAQNYFYEYYQRSVLNKILYKASLSGIISKINVLFKTAVDQFRPDLIWVFKGMEITPDSLKWARAQNIKLVNYNPDNPFIFLGPGSGNKNVTDSIPLYDMHFTYNLSIQERLERDFKIRTVFLPFGYDLSDQLFTVCTEQEEITRVCFAGNPDKDRAAFIEQMAGAGIPMDVFGNNWERAVTHPGIRIFEPVYGDDFWKVLRRYRVQLNLMRIHNLDSHNMRSFEVPAVGGIMLAPDTREHRLFFEDGREALWFNGIHEAVEKAKQLLGMQKLSSEEIRKNARERTLRSGYSYKDRTNLALEKLNELVPEW
jgi:spore maturation protein CgeB